MAELMQIYFERLSRTAERMFFFSEQLSQMGERIKFFFGRIGSNGQMAEAKGNDKHYSVARMLIFFNGKLEPFEQYLCPF